MKNFKLGTQSSVWLVALLAAALVTGCGGGNFDPVPSAGADPDVGTDPDMGTDPDAGTDPDTETPAAPTATSSSPANNDTDVAVSSAVTVTFSEAMDEATINGTTFSLTGPDAASVAGEVSYSAENNTATLMPAGNLDFNTLYTATISTDAQNEAGTALAEAFSFSFTTIDGDAMFITVTEQNPLDNSTVCPSREIRVTFDSPLDPASIESPATNFVLTETLNTSNVDGQVSLDALATTATFTPEFDLIPDLEYTVTVTTEVADLNGNNLETDLVWNFTVSDSVCQAAINLGATEPFGVLSNTGITLGGGPDSTTGLRVDGDVGIFPAGACNGCDLSTVSGVIEIGNTPASDAIDALEAAFDEAINLADGTCTLIDSGALTTNPSATCGGNADGVFAPGLYWSGTSIAIPAGGTITFDAQNDADAVFIFQSESTIDTIGGDTRIILANGAQAKNVFWVAGSSATIGGTNSDFVGTILALIGITVNTGTEMNGRALARGAEVTVQDGALITVPAE